MASTSADIQETTEAGRAAVEGSARPKRARKQTQRYTAPAASTTTTRKPRAPRKAAASTAKRATAKGKGRAAANSPDDARESPATEEDASEPPKKKARKVKEEERLAPFKDHCPQNILERAERVRTQRFFMIDRMREGKELKEEFKVLGSTGNVYTVVVDHKPKCDCPDNRRGNHCKHIMFIFLKVLGVSIESHIWYQKALLTDELETIFSQAREAPNSVTNPRIREAFLRATGQVAESSSAAHSNKRRIPGEDDDCPICYDAMHGVPEASLVFCEECGNALHKECFTQYESSARKNGRPVTCVWCRSSWGVVAPRKTVPTTKKGGFLNLANAADSA